MKNLVRFFWILVVFMTAFGFTQVSAENENSQVESFRQNKTVELPPYIVLTDRGVKNNPWKYISIGSIEVLSYCETSETRNFVRTFVKRQMELAEILPGYLAAEQSAKQEIILITTRMYNDMREQMERVKKSENFSVVSQVILWDDKSIGSTFELKGFGGYKSIGSISELRSSGDYSGIAFMPVHIKNLLEMRTPRLPVWFRDGMVSLYQEMYSGLSTDDDEKIKLVILLWPASPDKVLPMDEFLKGPFDGQGNLLVGPQLNLWVAQDRVFLRWAFDDKNRSHREMLWRFADASSREAVTEALFKRCFGIGFSEMEKELSGFIRRKEKVPIEILDESSLRFPDPSDIPIRNATAIEIARIKGGFDIKEINYIVDNAPQYTQQYLGQAEADLLPLYEKGVRDPDFMKVYNEFEKIKARIKLKPPTAMTGKD